MNSIERVKIYMKDVHNEMKKVSWPNRQELKDSTVVVILMVFIIALLIGLMDRFFNFGVSLILGF